MLRLSVSEIVLRAWLPAEREVQARDLLLLDLWGWGGKIERRKFFQILIPNIGSNEDIIS
jgi:hypothetical protein